MSAIQQPEAYIGHAFDLLDAEGSLIKPDAKSFLESFMRHFEVWIEHNVGDDARAGKD